MATEYHVGSGAGRDFATPQAAIDAIGVATGNDLTGHGRYDIYIHNDSGTDYWEFNSLNTFAINNITFGVDYIRFIAADYHYGQKNRGVIFNGGGAAFIYASNCTIQNIAVRGLGVMAGVGWGSNTGIFMGSSGWVDRVCFYEMSLSAIELNYGIVFYNTAAVIRIGIASNCMFGTMNGVLAANTSAIYAQTANAASALAMYFSNNTVGFVHDGLNAGHGVYAYVQPGFGVLACYCLNNLVNADVCFVEHGAATIATYNCIDNDGTADNMTFHNVYNQTATETQMDFIDSVNEDYHINIGSVATRAGLSAYTIANGFDTTIDNIFLPAVLSDIDNQWRSPAAGWSVGADEVIGADVYGDQNSTGGSAVAWRPRAVGGDFYIRDRHYYLYADKATYTREELTHSAFQLDCYPESITGMDVTVEGHPYSDFYVKGDILYVKHPSSYWTDQYWGDGWDDNRKSWCEAGYGFAPTGIVTVEYNCIQESSSITGQLVSQSYSDSFPLYSGWHMYKMPQNTYYPPLVMTDDNILPDNARLFVPEYIVAPDNDDVITFNTDYNYVMNPDFAVGVEGSPKQPQAWASYPPAVPTPVRAWEIMNPSFISNLAFNGPVSDIAYANGYCYAAANAAVFDEVAIDVSVPTAPVVTWCGADANNCVRVVVEGDLLFFSGNIGDINLFDIGVDPSSPDAGASIGVGYYPVCASLALDHIYAMSASGGSGSIYHYYLTDFAHITLKIPVFGHADMAGNSAVYINDAATHLFTGPYDKICSIALTEIAGPVYRHPTSVVDSFAHGAGGWMKVRGDRLYASQTANHRFSIYDVSDPTNINNLVGFVDHTHDIVHFDIIDNYAICIVNAADDQLIIIDIFDETNPQIIYTYTGSGNCFNCVAVGGINNEYAFVGKTGNLGMDVFQIKQYVSP